jgi:alpha-L-rhamnosidase
MLRIKPNRLLTISIPILILLMGGAWAVAGAEGPRPPSHLRCEYLPDPLGIDVTAPRLSWVLDHSQRGENQTAYQVLVSGRLETLNHDQGDQWDSGQVPSGESTQVVYNGKPVESGHTYYWKVRYWDNEKRASDYSAPARFEMGLLSRQEWNGKWITGNELRREFHLEGKVVRARAYVTALGYYELRINGEKAGDRVLDPAWTTYPKRVLYSTYDVTRALAAGQNAVGVTLGGGWATLGYGMPSQKPYYSQPALLLQMNIELEGGKRISVVSDESWKAAPGPIVTNSVYDGEVYDARIEAPGWDRAAFDESKWTPAQVVAGSSGAISAQMMPPIRVVDTLMPQKMTSPQPGVYVYDMGQNISGWAQLRVCGPRGTAVTLRFAETTFPDGNINQENLRSAKAREVYILRGAGEETFEPHFTYHGFRYIEVTGFPGTPGLQTLRGRVAHTAVDTIGNFSASTQILNDIQRAIWWTQLTNLFSIPTDCDQRDERQGWMGDAQISAEEAMLNFDMAAFYTNFIRDMRDAQGDDGTIPETVPQKWGHRPADPAWGTAYPTICWYMWQQYRDRRILEENYEGLKKYVQDLRRRAPDNVLRFNFNGDWIPMDEAPGEVISDAYYFSDLTILKDVAGILGKTADEQEYSQLAQQVKDAFNQNFLNTKTHEYGGGSQTADSMALVLGLVPAKEIGQVEWRLFKNVLYLHNTHLTTGFIGTKFLMPALSDFHNVDLAYDLAVQTSYPSWGHMLERGLTTIAEVWPDKGERGMYSRDHPALGSVGAWFYQALGGIKPGSGGEGYRHIRIAPLIPEGLQWASATVDTLRGTVSSSWTYSAQMTRLDVTVPVNADAEILIPKNPKITEGIIREGDKVIWQKGKFVAGDDGVTAAHEEDRSIVVSAGSGHYVLQLSEN